MGGYGGAKGKVKDKCYYDTGGHKVTDKNVIEVGELYIKEGKYVAFLQERPPQHRADLSVEGIHIEVKGLSTLKPDTIKERIIHAVIQIRGDDYRYPPETHRQGKVIILSKHKKNIPDNTLLSAMNEGLRRAKLEHSINEIVEVWIGNRHIRIN